MAADGFFDHFHVVLGGLGQVLPAADGGDILLPAGDGGQDGLGTIQQGGEGEFIRFLAIQLIADADGDFLQIAENVQLGEGDGRGGLHFHAIAGGHQIDGAYPTGTAGLGAILRASLAQALRFLSEHLADEGAFADAGGVGLDYAYDLIHGGGGQAGTHRCIGGDGVGGGGVGHDAIIQIPQGAQLGFVKEALALLLGLTQDLGGIADKGLQLFAIIIQPGHQILQLDRLRAVDAGEGQVFPLQQLGGVGFQGLPIEQLAGQEGLFLILIGIEGGDALLGGAIGMILQAGFLQAVQLAMPGQQQGGPIADAQVIRRQGDALGADLLHLDPEVFQIQGHAVAQDVQDALPEDAGGQEMEGEFAIFVDDGMAGVAAALVADDDVVAFGEEVDHAAFAFVAPVDAYNCAVAHWFLAPFLVLVFFLVDWGTPFPQPQWSRLATSEIASFRLNSPPMKFPPLAVIGGESPCPLSPCGGRGISEVWGFAPRPPCFFSKGYRSSRGGLQLSILCWPHTLGRRFLGGLLFGIRSEHRGCRRGPGPGRPFPPGSSH